MDVLVLVAAVLLGAVVGSFLNVLVLRLGTGMTLGGRSACFSCTHTLLWYELVPVVSFVVLSGRCRHCGSKLSWQYPITEAAAALLWGLLHIVFWQGVLSLTYAASLVYFGVLFSLLLAILLYDIKHKIIPDSLVYTAAGLSLLATAIDFSSVSLHVPRVLDVLAGPLIAAPFVALWLFSGGRWMGLGDGKLALCVGWTLGLSAGLTAVLFSFWSGAVVGVVLMALVYAARKWGTALLYGGPALLTMKSEVPFAPFLIVSLWAVFYTGFDLVPLLTTSW